jgi:hypothetical protein
MGISAEPPLCVSRAYDYTHAIADHLSIIDQPLSKLLLSWRVKQSAIASFF